MKKFTLDEVEFAYKMLENGIPHEAIYEYSLKVAENKEDSELRRACRDYVQFYTSFQVHGR